MSRLEILENIAWTYHNVTELEKQERVISDNNYSIQKLRNHKAFEDMTSVFSFQFYISVFIFYIVFYRIFVDPVYWTFNLLYDSVGGFIAYLYFFFSPLVVYFLLFFIYRRYDKVKNSSKRNEEAIRLYELVIADKKEAHELQSLIHQHTVVPPKYQKSSILSDFYSYLDTQRADTLKECIQIFEVNETLERQERRREAIQQRHHEEMMASNEEVANEISRVGDQVEKSRYDYYK